MATKHLKIMCIRCNQGQHVSVPEDAYAAYLGAGPEDPMRHIQVALPMLTPDERELLISRTCGPCFDKMFGDSE